MRGLPINTVTSKLQPAAILASLCMWAMALGAPGSAAADPCPNEALREAQGTVSLPECMALEMVSPPKKLSLPAFLPWFSFDGERVVYRSLAALGETPAQQHVGGDYYVATRSASGWQTAATSPPASAHIYTGINAGGPFAFSSDLGSWLVLGATKSQAISGVSRTYEGTLEGSFEPFSPLMSAQDNSGGQAFQFLVENLAVQGAAESLSRAVFRTSRASAFYFDEDPRHPGLGDGAGDEVGAGRNSYVVSNWNGEPSLELLARDKDDVVYGGRCAARLGGGANGLVINQGAISADAETIYFTTRPAQPFDPGDPEAAPVCSLSNPLRVMERVGPPGEAVISEIAPELPAGDDLFQGASADGTKAYFTTARQVTAADLDTGTECSSQPGSSSGCDLYLYDSTKPEGERLTLVSAGPEGPTPGEGANVLSSITAVSGDGSRAYFAAQGILAADPNPAGDLPVAGQPNLYVYERSAAHPAGRTAFIGTLDATDKGGMWGTESSFTGDAYAAPLRGPGGSGAGDGHVLAFASAASLTDEDLDGGHSDVFRYDDEVGTLTLVSGTDPAGAYEVEVNPNPSSSGIVFGTLANLPERGRWASEDGETVAFISTAPVAPGDADGDFDPFFWKAGELTGIEAAVFETDDLPVVSLDGAEVALATSTTLLPQDRDKIRDVYVLRANGGFPIPSEEAACDPLSEGSCQGQSLPAPPLPASATTSFSGPGNQSKPGKCRKGSVRKRGRCVRRKQAKRRHAPKRKHNARNAGRSR